MSVENKPKILRGAFVEFGLSLPPLIVVFQFNPMQLTRNRELSFDFPNPLPPRRGRDGAGGSAEANRKSLRQYHNRFTDLLKLQKGQLVTVQEQTIAFEMRLDASAGLDEANAITRQFGIARALAPRELVANPKKEGVLAGALAGSLAPKPGHSFPRGGSPPLVLFIFG